MDWRVLMRRCPSKSMTIVGDLAQRQSEAGAVTWSTMLEPHVARRWRYRHLTINYRTPSEIMEVASQVLPLVAPRLRAPESLRGNGRVPEFVRSTERGLRDAVVAALAGWPAERSAVVIAPDGTVNEADVDVDVDIDVDVVSPRASKGLEFDLVVVVEPGRILADPAHGAGQLYVALTRATQHLIVIHTDELPSVLHDVARAS